MSFFWQEVKRKWLSFLLDILWVFFGALFLFAIVFLPEVLARKTGPVLGFHSPADLKYLRIIVDAVILAGILFLWYWIERKESKR